MEYTIKKLSEIAGISTRTLRYYDEINLLKPKRLNSSGYRIYGKEEIDLLQQIMFYKEFDIDLYTIKKIITNENFDTIKALKSHKKKLLLERERIDTLIENVEKTINSYSGEINISEKEKFMGLKRKIIEHNESLYGSEIREKYGEGAIVKFNRKFLNMNIKSFERMEKLENEVLLNLEKVFRSKDLDSEFAKNVFEKHRDWLKFTWSNYTKESHAQLTEMYVNDERFTKYYDEKIGKGATKILRDIIKKYSE